MISNDVIIAYRKYAISQAGISIMDRGVGGDRLSGQDSATTADGVGFATRTNLWLQER